jgi:Glycosyl hydrolase family 99
MRLLRAQHCLIALIFISFLACMIITIGFTSDTDILALLFGESKDEKDSSGQLEGLMSDRLKTYVVISNSTSKSGNLNQYFNASQIRRFVKGRHMANKSASFPSFSSKPIRVNDAFDSGRKAELPALNYNIHLFYYPWYGSPEVNGRYLHWNHRYLPHWKPEVSARFPSGRHQPPEGIGATFYPRLGPYSSSDPQVIENHMQQIQRTGAG